MNQKYLVALLAFAVLALGAYALRDTFVQDAAAPAAQPSQVVELKNGDTYALTAAFVEKKIGSKTFRMLAYNGSIPGPLLKALQGAEVTINFTNNTDIDTTLHSHGLRLDNKFDGTPGLTQDPIKPGATFTYKLKFPDAGMYWYHPHEREDYAQELGLYGNYLVTPSNDKYWSPVNREVPLFLDDILVQNGKIPLNKTNQLNMTTRRMTEPELKAWTNEPGNQLWAFRVADKFGDSGITGIVSLTAQNGDGRISDFILSCRVMSRKVEETLLAWVVARAREAGLSRLVATFIPTAKNRPTLDVLKRSGFRTEDDLTFVWDLKSEYPVPSCLTLAVR